MYDWRFFLLYISIVLLVSVGAYRWFEQPLQDRIRKARLPQ
jgi:peptidoglycan/LPS O-acetylase OafA/YrhL